MLIGDGYSVLDTGKEIMAKNETASEVKVVKVPIDKIRPNPYQPRKTFDEDALEELCASIRKYGVLQPLLVSEDDNGAYMLIAGERRLRASHMAELKEVPVIISEYTDQQIAEIALIENLQREDLHYLEEAEGYEQLLDKFSLTQENVAARVGKKQSTVANKLRLLRLSSSVRAKLVAKKLSERHARALLKIHEDAKREEALDTIIEKGYNVRQTEEYIRRLVEDKGKRKRVFIVSDVRIFVNTVKKIASDILDAGIPATFQQTVENDEVVVTLRIKNQKKPRPKKA